MAAKPTPKPRCDRTMDDAVREYVAILKKLGAEGRWIHASSAKIGRMFHTPITRERVRQIRDDAIRRKRIKANNSRKLFLTINASWR